MNGRTDHSAERTPGGGATIEEMMARLARIADQIESHRTAIWVLEDERQVLRTQLRIANFNPAKAVT